LKQTEVVEDMMRTVRRNTPSDFSVSVKIRLLNKDIKETVDMCRKLQSLNPTFITIHGRTPSEKSSAEYPVDANAISEIKKSLTIPVIFNGDVTSLKDAESFHETTGADGFMSARGILSNPALFSGYETTPLSCIQDWINIHHQQGDKMTFQNFHHHMVFMMEEGLLKRAERTRFNELTKKQQCLDFIKDKFSIEPEIIEYPANFPCTYDDSKYKGILEQRVLDRVLTRAVLFEQTAQDKK
jgi:tRNA-dihydrouridine synthase 4